MLDIKKIINNEQVIIENLNQRGEDFTNQINEVSSLYQKYVKELKVVEQAKAKINEQSKLIGMYKQQQKDISKLLVTIEDTKKKIDEKKIKQLDQQIKNLLLTIPNIIDRDTPIGKNENENVEIDKFGLIREFDFAIKSHDQIGEKLAGLDFKNASKISKARFVITKGFVAKLERAITNFMLEKHIKNGYLEFGIPVIANQDTLYASGQLPKFSDDLFKIARSNNNDDEFSENERDFYLIPTAEVVLANYHRDEILNGDDLTLNYTAYSQCFRKEAGSAGRDTKGLIRVHQFGKVELFKYTKPQTSNQELLNMLEDAKKILEALKLPYRVLKLCSGDLGFNATMTYDLEVWLPSQNTYRECSSCSNVLDFQARRAKIRYKNIDDKIEFVHMLNGSGMATGRILAAVLENYQNADGSVEIPAGLKRYWD